MEVFHGRFGGQVLRRELPVGDYGLWHAERLLAVVEQFFAAAAACYEQESRGRLVLGTGVAAERAD